MMTQKTHLARSIEAADEKAQYDEYAKRIVVDKNILAWIAKYTVQELKEYSISTIVSCIEGDPEVSEVPIHPKERIKIIINVEIQKDFYPGYDLVTRGVFYCARMLSAQLDTEFTAENYDDLKKVYSIWLCLNAPAYLADTVTQFSIKQENIIGEFKKKTSKLHGMLGTVFSEKLSAQEKTRILEEEYEIEAKREIEEGIGSMCNLSDAVEERGEEKKLIELICCKLQKEKSVEIIAEELDEESDVIKRIYDAAIKAAPVYDKRRVYDILHYEM